MRGIVLIFLIFIYGAIHSQRIINFNLYPANNIVGVSFTLTKGNNCGGYKILHSLDSLNFSTIEDYVGICGNTSTDDVKGFTHNSPALNQKNYYKVVLSTLESTLVKSVLITVQNAESLNTFPNPVNPDNNLIYFRIQNPNNALLKCHLYDQFGKLIREFEITNNTGASELDISTLKNGLYLFSITIGEKKFTSKFIVNR